MASGGLITDYIDYASGAPTSTRSGGPTTVSGNWGLYQNTANGDVWAWNLSGTPGWTKLTALSNPMTTAEDIIKGGSSGTPARVAVGTNGYVLTVTAGVVGWAAASGGGSFSATADTTLGSGAASIDFSSLSGAHKHLLALFDLRGDASDTANSYLVRLNGDSGANYDYVNIASSTGTSLGGGSSNGATSAKVGYASYVNANANSPSTGTLWVPNYASTVFHKSLHAHGGAAGATGGYGYNGWGIWHNTAAVTQITFLPFSGNFITGSRVSIYLID